MKNILFVLVFLLSISSLLSQTETHDLFLQSTANGYQLRWFPADFDTWLAGITDGYNLERSANGGNTYQRLSQAPIHPTLKAGSKAHYLYQQVITYQDSLRALPNTPTGQRLRAGIYREYCRAIAASIDGISQSGLFFEDLTAVAEVQYRYRLSLASGLELATVNTSQVLAPVSLPSLEVSPQEYRILLRWQQARGKESFQAFRVAFSEDGNIFTSSTNNWHFPRAYKAEQNVRRDTFAIVDSVAQLNKVYFYRLVGIDAFGKEHTGPIIKVISKDITPPAAPVTIELEANRGEGLVVINWEATPQEDDFSGYNLYRSRQPDEGYTKINNNLLEGTSTTYTDQISGASGSYFYKLAAVDQTGNEGLSLRRSVTFADKTAPAIPQGLRAKHDTLGLVSVSWRANTEADLKGYQLARGRYLEDEFVPLSQNAWPSTHFLDTLPLHFVDQTIYYKLAAVDRQGNVSAFSAPFQIILPDTIAPISPFLQTPALKSNTLTLQWETGMESDLSFCEVFRRSTEEQAWKSLIQLKPDESYTQTEYGSETWQYAVQAVDLSGNRSAYSNVRTVQPKAVETTIPAPQELLVSRDIKLRVVNIDWTYLATKQEVRYLIFRKSASDEAPQLLAIVGETSYQDRSTEAGLRYQYFVMAQGADGRYSPTSNPVEIIAR